MQKIDPQKLLKMGKKCKKWLESISVNLDAYIVNGHAFYLAIYEGKFSSDEKGYAVLSPDINNKKEALQAFKPHIYYGISNGIMEEKIKTRAELDFTVWEDIRDYLEGVVEANVLEPKLQTIYSRSLTILKEMIRLQKEMIALWHESHSFYENINQKGYFTDEDIETSIKFGPVTNLIQYKQFKDRYEYRGDFDVIYENRNNPVIQPFTTNLQHRVLKAMTSLEAERDIKATLDLLRNDCDLTNKSDAEIKEIWLKYFKNGLDTRVKEIKEILRYP